MEQHLERATYLHRANTNPTLHNFTRGNLRSSLSEPRKREGEKIETVTPFFPDHLVEASNGNRVTRCRGVSATAFPNFRNNGPCVRVRARVVVRIPTPSRSQRINANAQRERERSERRETTRLQNRARIPYETQTQKRNANWPHQSEQTMPWMPPMAQQRVVSQITVRHVAHRCASNAEQCTIRNTRLPSLPSAAYRLVAVPLLEGDARFSPIPPR